MQTFEINDELLAGLDDYKNKAFTMQQFLYDGNFQALKRKQVGELVDDDLVFNVPIYDMIDRRYAAFCSFLEALKKGYGDPKQNGNYFVTPKMDEFSWWVLFYLFRLCGSGINYIPKTTTPIGSHGFGNFWLVQALLDKDYSIESWMNRLKNSDKCFTNNKGYLLPQFSYPNMTSGHLKKYILEESLGLVEHLYEFSHKRTEKLEIYSFVDEGNTYLMKKGYKRQNFVLSAFAMDCAEYYPNVVDRKSKTYVGSNAQRCLRSVFKKLNRAKDFDFQNDCMQFLAERYNTVPYSVEDVTCDSIRYIQEFQSQDHIDKNKGIIYKNNSILKELWGHEKYYEFAKKLK